MFSSSPPSQVRWDRSVAVVGYAIIGARRPRCVLLKFTWTARDMIPGLIVEWLLVNQVSSKSKKLHDQKQQHHISLSLLLASDWLLMLLMMVCVFGRWRSLVVGCACISPYVDPALAMEICICIIGRLLFLSNLFEILLITNSNMNVFNVLVFLLQPASAQKRLSAPKEAFSQCCSEAFSQCCHCRWRRCPGGEPRRTRRPPRTSRPQLVCGCQRRRHAREKWADDKTK